jgi:hypothetical protein
VNPVTILSLCCACAQVIVIARIATLRILRSYPWFTVYLAVAALQVAIPLSFDYRSRAYLVAYTLSMCILMPLRFAVAFEAWRLAMSSYPRIGSAAREIAWWSLGIGLLFAANFGFDGFKFSDAPHSVVLRMVLSLLIRYSATAIFVLCAALWTITTWFDHGVRPNARTHNAILTGYFLLIAAEFFAIHRYPEVTELTGLVVTGATAGLWTVWAVTMKNGGERPAYRDLTLGTSILGRLST